MAAKLLNLIALSSLAILACSFGATPVNALSVDVSPNHARSLGHHQLIAKKKRAESRRCKPRSTSSSVRPTSTPAAPVTTTPKATSTPKPASTTPKPAPTTTKHVTTVVPPVQTPVTNPGGGKAGLAWVNPASVPLKNFVTKKTGYVYSWSPWIPAGCKALGLKFAPMLWGPNQGSDFKRLTVAGYADVALGFNEPDHAGQANMSPGAGVSLWWQYLEPLKAKGYRLASPAVTSGQSGKPWLQSFLNQCSGCHVDIITVHWYGTDPNAFIAYVKDFHATFNKPIWVTEFACQNFSGGAQCSQSQAVNFINVVTAFMDSADYVEQYFAFGFMHDMGNVSPVNQLLGSNNMPTDLGWNYLT